MARFILYPCLALLLTLQTLSAANTDSGIQYRVAIFTIPTEDKETYLRMGLNPDEGYLPGLSLPRIPGNARLSLDDIIAKADGDRLTLNAYARLEPSTENTYLYESTRKLEYEIPRKGEAPIKDSYDLGFTIRIQESRPHNGLIIRSNITYSKLREWRNAHQNPQSPRPLFDRMQLKDVEMGIHPEAHYQLWLIDGMPIEDPCSSTLISRIIAIERTAATTRRPKSRLNANSRW